MGTTRPTIIILTLAIFEMRLFLTLLVLLASATSLKKVCRQSTKRFIKKCLSKGFKPRSLPGCLTTDGNLKKRVRRKCNAFEKTIYQQSCEVPGCEPPPVREPKPKPNPARKPDTAPKPIPKPETVPKPEKVSEPKPDSMRPNVTVSEWPWCRHEDSFLYNYAGDSFKDLAAAKKACLANYQCGGITQVCL